MPFTIPTPSFLRRSGSSSSLSSPKKGKGQKIKINVESATQQQPSPSPSPTNSELSSSTSLFTKGAVKSNQSNTSNSNLNVLPKQREAITPPPLSIPKLNTNVGGSGSNSAKFPLSPRSRQLSDRVRAAPSSLVRQLRSYSNSIHSLSYMNDNSDPNLSSPKKFKLRNQNLQSARTVSGQELIRSNKQMMDTLPPELQPVVTLINAQKLRTYAVGTFQVPGIDENGQRVWIEVEGKLTGNELAIWRPSEEEFLVDMADEFKPRYINLTDVKLEWGAKDYEYDLKISQTFDEAFLIKFNEPEDLNIWSAAICLSNLEYTSLNEAFTAVILSLKGSKLSDIHILLSQKKRFAKNEWCNLRIPQISSKWLKLYVSIVPQDGKKKNGRIEIYLNEKMSKKNLILYVNKLYDVYNVYPEQPNMIDFNTIMKLDGEIHINKNFQYLFEKNSANDALSPPPRVSSFAFKSHSRTSSATSFSSVGGFPRSTTTSSFFSNAPSPTKELFSPSSPSSGLFKKADLSSKYAVTNCLYLMPVAHPGVSGMETMIRNFIDIIDAFKLYGRPSHLFSDKTDKRSMLFGLPSLPHYKYLSMEEAVKIVKKSFRTANQENWEGHEWRNAFKSFINDLQMASDFKGHGDLYRLYESFNNLEIDDVDYGISSVMGSPQIKLPKSLVMPEYETGSDDIAISPHPLTIQQDRDLIIETYLSEPTYSLENSRGGSGTNLYEDASSRSQLGSPLDFSEKLKAAAQKASSTNLAAQSQTSSEHPYYYMVNKSAEVNKV